MTARFACARISFDDAPEAVTDEDDLLAEALVALYGLLARTGSYSDDQLRQAEQGKADWLSPTEAGVVLYARRVVGKLEVRRGAA